MNFIRRIFGKKKPEDIESPASMTPTKVDPAGDPNMIRVFDKYGREMFISKEQWRDNVLLGNLEKARDNPEKLYNMLVFALRDGLAADIVPYAELLHRTDPVTSRGATILGIVYMELNRLDDAQRVFEEFVARHGDEGVVLTNLAKVYSRRGDDVRAEAILWHALELDPNQENGLEWYAAIHRDRGGEGAALDAFRRVAALPRSWRARLWLARDSLQRKNLSEAQALYAEALARTERPVPTDFLTQMSGDLGNSGYLAEIILLVEPHFDAAFHDIQVGNNLIKANLDLGRPEDARRVLNSLYARKRPDWRETLSYWDTELAKFDSSSRTPTSPESLSVSIISIEGPLWARDGSPFAELIPAKRRDAPRVAVYGGSVLRSEPPERPVIQLADAPGRISRAVPLLFAEHVHLLSDAVASAWVPWAQGEGFALSGRPYEDQDLCSIAGKEENGPDFVVGITIDARRPAWKLALRLVRRTDGRRLGEGAADASADYPGPAVEGLAQMLVRLLVEHAGVRMTAAPAWYQRPAGPDASDYLLRLEQQLAVTAMHLDFIEGGGLYGERELLDGILQLCVRQPKNLTVRLVFAQTLRQLKKVRPAILPEYKDKIDLLHRDCPLAGDVARLIEQAIREAVGA